MHKLGKLTQTIIILEKKTFWNELNSIQVPLHITWMNELRTNMFRGITHHVVEMVKYLQFLLTISIIVPTRQSLI